MSKSIKLLCLNVSLFDDNNAKLAKFLKEEKPDIVCLQEVSRKVDDSAYDEFISKDFVDTATTHLPFSSYAPNWSLKDFWQKNFHGKELFEHDFGGIVEYGNYTKSKFSITSKKSVFVQGKYEYITDWEEFAKHPGEESRNVLVVDLQIDGQNVRILNYHGIWSRDKRGTSRTEAASTMLLQLAREVDYPTILCGDFNLFPDTKSMQMLNEKFVSLVDEYKITHTRPQSNELSSEKRNVVDYMLVTNDIIIDSFTVLDSDVSDHLPLVLEFRV
ncbi:MAG TPA: endonuclease/exonuclease/phosphatase family protein [Candidatus Eisenbacteria bacterium]|nr:endonuclease/exonuclease/phosphatase family protein [Candidatus Eisenbacteria bacterium]